MIAAALLFLQDYAGAASEAPPGYTQDLYRISEQSPQYAKWQACVLTAARVFARTDDQAELVTRAAFTQCAEEERAAKFNVFSTLQREIAPLADFSELEHFWSIERPKLQDDALLAVIRRRAELKLTGQK